MAPSELGQPKAPDKWDNKTTSSDVTTALDAGPQQREPPSTKSTNASSQPDTKVKDSAANEETPQVISLCGGGVFVDPAIINQPDLVAT